jgi:hypothetical protein
MARAKRATKKKTRISPTDALHMLMPHLSAHHAAKRLTDSVHTKECQLWEGDRLIRPEIAVQYLVIIARADKDGCWQASVEGREETRWLGPFTFEADEVRALLPRAKAFEPPSAEPAASERVKPGPDPQHNWPDSVTIEVIRRLMLGEKFPKAPAMLKFCRTKWDWEPEPRQMQRLLKHLRGD